MAPYRAEQPASTALRDQADAATRAAERVLQRLADRLGTTVAHGELASTAYGAIVRKFGVRLLAGELTRCPHLAAMAPASWVAHRPGRLRCWRCVGRINDQVRGTTEDRTCDHCRRVVPEIRPGVVQLPAIVNDRLTAPPVLILFGLCRDCCDIGQRCAAE